ncbi:MAG: hypothetical protein WBO36_01715, partial [Saprospiraceae bacterium]
MSGTKWSQNIITTDINGNTVNINNDLDAGKTVILDIFATWCLPCWTLHKSEVLKSLHQKYGVDGSNQLRIYSIEGDDRTTLDDLKGTSSLSLGNWLEGVTYSIINNHTFNAQLRIPGFSILYMIRPDRTILEVPVSMRLQIPLWEAVIVNSIERNAMFSDLEIRPLSFCNSLKIPPLTGINIGKVNITSVEIEVKRNGNSQIVPITMSQAIKSFEMMDISLQNINIETTAEIEINYKSINGLTIPKSNAATIFTQYYKPTVADRKLKIEFTTDYHPA